MAEKEGWYDVRRAYKSMIKLIDDQVGKILDTLEKENILEDTVILFTGDHGEMLGDRSLFGKSTPWGQSAIVPAAIRHPAFISGLRINSPIELTDITATILDIAGVDPDKALSKRWPSYHDRIPCKSLMPIIKGERKSIRKFAFSRGSEHWDMLRTEKWMYLRINPDTLAYKKPRELLFDLKADPESLTDVSGLAENAKIMVWFRKNRDHLLTYTLPAQTRWVRMVDEDVDDRLGAAPFFPSEIAPT
jgi:arylsulfatase